MKQALHLTGKNAAGGSVAGGGSDLKPNAHPASFHGEGLRMQRGLGHVKECLYEEK